MLSQAAQHEDCSPEIRTTLERVIVSEHTAWFMHVVEPLTVHSTHAHGTLT